ncbi:MAG: type I glyceraldehyde-3-phosphate dehydrogenase [Candidatus Komeilibacteria bacterium CG_4_10_14_0_2_um_filter_37_10]|uniref:Type I glyceraldehyde-3-phosphate dehydrogenase n=1 Tax=Candidatus Komeilibacteria bacterium CG_4_10_14_0_2_um_filter_37_10 TaxID=1974470 RepID=A0A2M7VGL9_9BACT|nr:MAG: type I glyceraldehyde-3-phosphate dehydrogenase [Candidatus Komeilibacteria bacterium CG_4_10_14_0_2_um_filter_37_10]PJA92650.1 MAG: type I glyceraldehyde-3-phosphate dehydrogenase [Candidatus Komeilibacteria bacterium CG_4_9_14_3_um_filter_37_5]
MTKNKIRVAINGFGRIGRAALKIVQAKSNVEVVAINDLTEAKTLAHLLKYDTAYGQWQGTIEAKGSYLVVNKKRIPVYAQLEPEKLPWKKLKVDVVLECTGKFRTKSLASKHLRAGALKVIISAPAKGDGVATLVLGVNEENYRKQKVVNNASCTTNCVAPIVQIIDQAFGIDKAMMTTIHAYTADQNLVDGPHQDLRRARAAALNIIPTSTGAAEAVAQTLPHLAGSFDGLAVRVPVPVGSLADFTFVIKKKVTVNQVKEALQKASHQVRYKNIVQISQEPLVSSDIIGNPYSTRVDLGLTQVVGGNLVKIVAWYDNEWGYANRLVELAEYISQ